MCKGVLPRASVRIVARQGLTEASMSKRARPRIRAVPRPEPAARDQILPVVPRIGYLSLAVAPSYAGQLKVTISDPASATDFEAFARGVSDSKSWKLFAEVPNRVRCRGQT